MPTLQGLAAANGDRNLALFCDFENIALGVRDSKYADFDMRFVVQKLLVKGSIVVKKAYCDWERYKGYKTAMHEAAFELIEIPHVRQSGKPARRVSAAKVPKPQTDRKGQLHLREYQF